MNIKLFKNNNNGHLMKSLSSDPFTDWVIIVTSAVLVSISLVAVGFAVYVDTGYRLSAPPGAVAVPSSKDSFDQRVLDSVGNSMDIRASKTASLLSGKSYIPKNPSLP
ncbi:MAG: hypothetical protein KGI49_03610 [Patescibacteria group bacterium]|nr:hypothetical protein [Patescibacteria group bacterium]